MKSGYVAASSGRLAGEKLRRMLRRFALDEADAEVFLGMVRKIREEIGKMEGGR
jgi:tRNA C32,U32 (ribose-2'-O)-methylase TrmJ